MCSLDAPFELLLGRYIKGPLDLLKNNWLLGELEESNLCEWLASVQGRLVLWSEVVTARETKAKSEMKKYCDKSARDEREEFCSW